MRDDTAVSPVIGTLLILAMFTVVVTTIITVGRPQIVEYQERGEFQTVVNQLNKVANEASQLTISGNTNEVRQPTLKLPRGDLVVERGHHVAISIGYLDGNFSNVASASVAPGHHPAFFVQAADLTPIGGPDFGPDWDAMDQGIELIYLDDDYASTDRTVYTRLARWTGSDWAYTHNGAPATVRSGQALPPIPFIDEDARLANLTEGPWRIRVYHDAPLGIPDALIGEVYIYDLTRLKYLYSGEAGPRTAYLENGALIVTEHNQHRLVRTGLMAAPANGFGGTSVTARASILDESAGAAGGRVDLGLLMRVMDVEDWVVRGGAAEVRLQFSGLYPHLWYDHLDDSGFTADPLTERGVYYVDERTTPGSHSAFPVNVVYTEIDLRFRPK